MDKLTRQQLQDAARAAGYEAKYNHPASGEDLYYKNGIIVSVIQKWNPTTDLADSFRLMVDAKIIVVFIDRHSSVSAYKFGGKFGVNVMVEDHEGDVVTAAMQAIFNCATTIGSQMRTGE